MKISLAPIPTVVFLEAKEGVLALAKWLSYLVATINQLDRGYVDGSASAWSDATASRALNTAYRNQSGKKKHLAVVIDGATAGVIDAKLEIDSVTPPTVVRAQAKVSANALAATAHRFCLSGIVPNGWYYRAQGTTLVAWHELDE